MTEKRLWYILRYCDDNIEAEDKDEAYNVLRASIKDIAEELGVELE